MLTILLTILALLSLPMTAYLGLLTIGALAYPFRCYARPEKAQGRIAVIVPAYNEEKGLAVCLESLKRCCDQSDIVVVADNCTDNTAAIATEEGVRVLVRDDPQQRGKGRALSFAFETLMQEEFDFFAVIDADSIVSKNFICSLRRGFGDGADAVQCRYVIGSGGSSWRGRLLHVATTMFNVVRTRGRAFYGLSVGILGNGFALRRKVLEEVPYSADGIAEDLEYHLLLVANGFVVDYVDRTTVQSPPPPTSVGFSKQRTRWEGGRLALVRSWTPGLVSEIGEGDTKLVEPLVELLTPPLSYYSIFVLAGVASGSVVGAISSGIGLAVLAMHVGAAFWIGKLSMRDAGALAWAPLYIVWKVVKIPSIVVNSGKNAIWARTDRR